MGKDKLRKFAEVKSLPNVTEPEFTEALNGCPLKGKWNEQVFAKAQPLTLELGCGKGEYTVGQARIFPERNFIGVDIKGARIWRGAKTANEAQMGNVHFLRTRIDFIGSFFGPDEVSEIWITFPDPQGKKNRKRKRLTNPLFLERYRDFLKADGTVNLKTDDRPLYEYSLEVARLNNFEIVHAHTNIYNGPIDTLDPQLAELLHIRTYYEQKWLAEGREINFLSFRMKPGKLEDTPDEE